MLALLEVLLTYVGVMLVLALVAQSLQQVIKIVFAIKGFTRLSALKGLVVEAAKTCSVSDKDAEEIFDTVKERLAALGQWGVRKRFGKVRLDHIEKDELASLIKAVPTSTITSSTLDEIARKTTDWFDLAFAPVAERYNRRMRGLAVGSAAIVVLALNADALTLFEKARTDREFRTAVGAAVTAIDSLQKVADRLAVAQVDTSGETSVPPVANETSGSPGDTSTTGTASEPDSLAAVQDSILALALRSTGEKGFLSGVVGEREYDKLDWWIGILLSTLLVSLGAPFWNDLLGTLLGAKKRMRAQTESMRANSDKGT